jgi:hypothetical protein
MVDIPTALVVYLRDTSPLRTLLGGNYVYTPELPSTRSGDTKNVVFSVTGGQTNPYLRAQNLRVAFRCYGESSEDAREVYRALYDRLHATQNFIVGDVGFHGAVEEVPGTPLEDPGTDWPYIFTVYSIRVATVPVGDGGS